MMDNALNETVRSIRQKNLKKARGSCKPRSWREMDLLEGKAVDAGVVILPTKGCRWGRSSGCTMCGYVYEAGDLGDKDLAAAFQGAINELGEVPYLKLFTSGSFFDPEEVSRDLLDSIITGVNEGGIRQLQVESRPEFLTEDGLGYVKENLDSKLEIGIGLETSNDLIRTSCINKGFSFNDYKTAVKLCRSKDVYVKTYLLLKPPFILEREAIEDTVKSALDAVQAGSTKISINPMNIQRGTLVELLWRKGEYTVPWLWSLVEVLKQVMGAKPDVSVLSHPTGAGTQRGVHNCGECDSIVIKAIRDFSTTQDPSPFDSLDCGCKSHWSDYLILE